MKTLLALLTLLSILVLILFSCKKEKKTYEKPFIIVGKFPDSELCGKDYCHYIYVDKNGYEDDFCDDENKYSIGDTI
jgi:hypothetical protein